jgi:hypothetical protein
MRNPFVLLPIAALFVSLSAVAQEAPRVIFCQGQCFAVDAAGNKTPAPKGTQLLPGQRLETGAGTYAQVKLGNDAALGVNEGARVQFDRGGVTLDQGRIRMVGGDAFGRPGARPIELRTADGNFTLRGADVEVKKTNATGGAQNLTYMKLNAGDARLRNAQGDLALGKDAVHGFTGGHIVTGRSFSLAEVAIPQSAVAPKPGSTPTAMPPVAIVNTTIPAPLAMTTVVTASTPVRPTVPVAPILLTKPVATLGLIVNPAVATANGLTAATLITPVSAASSSGITSAAVALAPSVTLSPVATTNLTTTLATLPPTATTTITPVTTTTGTTGTTTITTVRLSPILLR